MDPPCQFSLTSQKRAQVEAGEALPGVTRPAGRTLTFSTQDYLDGIKLLRALIALARAS